MSGPAVELPAQLAVTLGMALHELTTNAARHGALSVYGGSVSVTWSVTVEADRSTLGIDWIEHYSAGAYWEKTEQADIFLRRIPVILQRFEGCDLLLYQAGADPHVDDPLGGWLTTAQLRERDRRVFTGCRAMGLPVAWNLAGGYQTPLRKVLDIHDHTMIECLAAFLP